MPYVEFLKTRKGGGQEVIGKAIFDGTTVTFEGLDAYWIARMQERGIIGVGDERLFPSQGLAFLKGLRVFYNGSRIRATDVKG